MKRTYMRWCCVVLCTLLLGWSSPTWSVEPQIDPTAPVTENDEAYDAIPEYQNAAQAQHDANLAEAYNANLDKEMAPLQEQLAAEENKPLIEQDPVLIDELDRQLEDLAAQKLGVDDETIAGMRADGMGWGEIAHELGVHPSVLGLGHTKTKNMKSGDAELAMATTMDMKTGNSIGHGKAYADGAGMSKNGNGNGGTHGGPKDKSDSKGGKGGNDHGNSNGNDNGNGNGNGNGKK